MANSSSRNLLERAPLPEVWRHERMAVWIVISTALVAGRFEGWKRNFRRHV